MRFSGCVVLSAVMISAMAGEAVADVKGYCRAYARNEANVHLAGRAVLDLNDATEMSRQDWSQWNKQAFADCMAQYEPEQVAETPAEVPVEAPPVVPAQPAPSQGKKAKSKPVDVKIADVKSATAKSKNNSKIKSLFDRTKTALATGKPGKLAPGSAEWKAYCAKKYVSFDPDTGTYLSLNRQRRPCKMPKR